jgi:hypothetical protein
MKLHKCVLTKKIPPGPWPCLILAEVFAFLRLSNICTDEILLLSQGLMAILAEPDNQTLTSALVSYFPALNRASVSNQDWYSYCKSNLCKPEEAL